MATETELNTDRLDDDVLSDICEHMGIDTGLSNQKDIDRINALSNNELFDHYCNWNGLIHWSGKLKNVVFNIYGIKED
jgi:hypothetical protein